MAAACAAVPACCLRCLANPRPEPLLRHTSLLLLLLRHNSAWRRKRKEKEKKKHKHKKHKHKKRKHSGGWRPGLLLRLGPCGRGAHTRCFAAQPAALAIIASNVSASCARR